MADQRSDRDPRDPLGRPRKDSPKRMRSYAAAAIAVLALILIVQNSQSVEFNFFFANTELPLVFGLLLAFGLGALTGWLLPRVRRRGDNRDRD